MVVFDPFRGVVFGINSLNTFTSVAKTVRKTPRMDQNQIFIDNRWIKLRYCQPLNSHIPQMHVACTFLSDDVSKMDIFDKIGRKMGLKYFHLQIPYHFVSNSLSNTFTIASYVYKHEYPCTKYSRIIKKIIINFIIQQKISIFELEKVGRKVHGHS